MNLDTARQAIRDFINNNIPVYRWDVDEPDVLYYNRGGFNIFANSAIELPLQEYLCRKEGHNGVVASGRFPYRVTWIFDGNQSLNSLPFKAVEGVVSNIQVLALIRSPHPDITQFLPYQEPDPVTISRTEDEHKNWLLSANFSFDCEFRVTEMADTSDLVSPGFFDLGDEPEVTSLTINVNKAEQQFDVTDADTYKLDTTITITP
ncbi:hypothetical protein CLI64_11065 [Nostoc sp. CENA543]|uniref:hypothetical protein n=1 Tax=Nostoc sp. CENA543 TaxID=1869241 RepID=UPI000CA151B2|nr:hypothetical protein [Nostoc sp. CENA543]AUT00894.1 hypothetical protein CLI64_11065 [Nostoc sp. CENA543]